MKRLTERFSWCSPDIAGRYKGKEADFQKACAQWLDWHYRDLLWFHTPNEGKHRVQYRRQQALMGVKPGVPDILIFYPVVAYSGLAIELKIGTSKPRQNQLECMAQLMEAGWLVGWTNSMTEFKHVVQAYMSGGLSRVSIPSGPVL